MASHQKWNFLGLIFGIIIPICTAADLRIRIPQEVQVTSDGSYHLLYDSTETGPAVPSNITLIPSRIHDPLSIEGLLPGVEYSFALYFTNSTIQNKQLWTATLPTTPDPPTNLTINILGGKVAEASWEPPAKGGYSGFKLSLVPLSEKDDNSVRNKYISHVTTPFLLRDLTPGASYEVQLYSVFHGQDSSVFVTKNFTTKPNTPGRFIVWFRNETTLLVLWQPPYPSGIFDKYRVSIMPEDAHESVLFADKDREPPGPAQAAFYGLVPGRNYNISVQTVSQTQISEPTKAQYRTVPLPPTNVTYDQTRLASYAFDVRWDPPKTLAEFDRYQVALGIRNTVRYLINKEEERVVTFDEELEPGHTYEVVVKTVSGNVASWPVTANVTTRPLPVKIVNSSSSGVGEIWVEWEPSANSTQDSYRVKYSDMETHNSGGSLLVVQNTSINLTSLLPGRNYSISVSSVSKRISSESAVMYQVTKPSSPVIEIVQPSADAWNISWKSDVTSRQDQYVVVYIRNDTGYLQERTTKNNWLVVDDLYPGARYEIKVYAISFGFRSEPHSYFQTIAPSAPRKLQVVKTSNSNMILVWMAPLNSLYGYFNVRYRPTGSAFWRELGLVNTTSCEINDLVPGERYAIQVSSVSKKVDSIDPAEVEQTMYPNPIKKVKEILDSFNMTFEWEVPQGLRDYFIIVYNPVSEPHDQQSLQVAANDSKPTEKASIKIENLKPGDLYSFRFYAVSHNLRSEGIGVQVRTRPVIDSVINIVTDEHETKTLGIKYTPTPRRSVVFDRYRFQLSDSSVPAQEKLFNDTNRLVIFDNLVPGRLYNISIWTISSGVNSVPIYRQARLYPEGISAVTALSLTDSEITLNWERPPGEMDVYEIEYQDHLGLLVKNITIRERNIFTALRPHHNYTFLVTVLSGYDSATTRRSRPLSETFQTLESVPGKVHLFRSVSVKPSEITLRWSLPSSEQHGILTGFKITYYEKGSDKPKHDFFEPNDFEGTIRDLKPGSSYIFEVQAHTKVGPGGTAILTESTPIWAPPVPESSVFPKLVSRTSSTITIGYSRSYFSSNNGKILAYTVIIAEDTGKESNGINMLSWSDVQQYPQWPPYQVIEPYYPFNNTLVEDFTIGAEKCTNVKGYCNGPLKPSSSYKVKVRAFTTSSLFTDTVFSYSIQTESDNSTLLAAVLAPIFILITLVILLLILWKRKLGLFAKKTRHSKADIVSIPESEIITSRIIKLRDFADHYRLMSADSDFRFSEEFELLKHVGKDRSCGAADLPVNRPKNRFTNILPYDHSRIKLLPTDDEEGTDYINANYIPGHNSPREFIVTQGPLHSTRDDFWRMVWEQNCRAIVMLTRCIEKGREKCDHYWPFDMQPVYYGDIQVTLLNESQYSHWTIAEFKVCRGDQSRVVKHFHFTTWPDFGVPEPPQILVKFVRTFRERVGTDPKPITVHCSAGVGRSGTFIALDRLMQHIQKYDYVDSFGIVYEMRKERVWMVQNEQQYICIHQCLLCVLEKKEDLVDIPRPEAHDNQGYDGTLCPVVRNGVCKSQLLEAKSVIGNKTNTIS